MRSLRRVSTFLNVKPGEERLISLLVLLYLIITLGVVFLQSMAFGLFLAEYGIDALPYSYISIAIGASLVAVLYIKLGGHVSFPRLLTFNLFFLGSVSLLVWIFLNSPLYRATVFILPLWFQTAINLGNLAVWPLAGSLFEFRQSKRLFPLLGAGNWLANIIGGLFINSLVKGIGPVNLLFLSVLCFAAGLFLVRYITRTYFQLPGEKRQIERQARPAKTPRGIFKDRYILLIFTYILLWWVAFFFVDNIFYNRAYAQYPDAAQLTAFIGRLLSIIGIVALISSTMISGRVIARFGLRTGLTAMPLAVTVIIGVLALGGSLDIALLYIFALSTLAKLINVAFGFSLSQSANAIVYQSLPDTIRRRVQTMAEGIVQPIAVGLAGIALLALTAGLKLTYIGIAYVFVGLGIIWLIVILLLSHNYVQALIQVITRRRLGESPAVLADPASVGLLKARLHDPHPGIAIYALTRLEDLDVEAVTGELPTLIQHPAPEVRREAFLRIEKLKLRAALNEVQKQLSVETVPTVKESALRALGAIGDRPPQLTAALLEKDAASLRGALIGLMKYSNDSAAEQKLNELLVSSSVQDRNLAIEVLGEINRREFDRQLIAACDSPETVHAAGLALASIGADALPAIESAFRAAEAPRQRLSTLAKVLGRIGGTRSQDILLYQISTPDHELRSQVLNALSQSGYRAGEIAAIQRAVRAEAEGAAWVSAVQADLGEIEETRLLLDALTQFHTQIRSRVLLLLSFVFDHDPIQRVREVFMTGTGTQLPYALEVMDVHLPTDWKKMVMPLLEDLSAEERCQRLSALFPQTRQDLAGRLHEIRERESLPDWLRTCVMYTTSRLSPAAREGENHMLSTVERVLVLKTVSIFSQTPDHVLADVAELLEEVDVAENETIFEKGDSGDSLYVILDGKVCVHDGERLLNYLGERDVFGEMALLDPEPRLASVTAVETTRLFRLDQASFYELMEERPEVATGIIRVLTRHLRNRVHDIAELNARIQELENGRPAS